MKKFLTAALALMLCLSMAGLCSAATYTPSFDIDARAAYLINLDSDMVIYDKNAEEKLEPSSLAQLMTVVLTLEKVQDIDNETATMKSYIEDDMFRQNISLGGIRLAGLYRNETLSIKNLIFAVMLRDANEAATVLADYVGDGSLPYFVEMMNERAVELGMNNTHFTSPHGLPDSESYTTAKDMAILARHAMSLPEFSQFTAVTSHNGGPTNINQSLNWNARNQMLLSTSAYFNRSVSGVKSGYHNSLGTYAITTAKRDGYSYLLVAMASYGYTDAQEDNSLFSVYDDCNDLYEWAFDTFKVKTLLEKGKNFGEVPLKLSWGKDFLRIMSAENFTALIPDAIESSSIQFGLDLPEYVEAPVKKGDLVGQVRLILAEEQIGVVAVIAAEDAEVSRALLLLQSVIAMTRTFWFKFAVILLTMLIVLYITLMIIRNRNKRRYYRGRR